MKSESFQKSKSDLESTQDKAPGGPALIVIPARYQSTRLPGKPLADIGGKPMIQWVFERAKAIRGVREVLIATDDLRVKEAVEGFGGKAVMTSSEITTGTERVKEVALESDAQIIVNMQGDEPLIEPSAVEKAIELVSSEKFPMGTLMTPFRSFEEFHDPSVVKVIADQFGRAVTFSRLPIPYSRGRLPQLPEQCVSKRHIGLYVFRRELLLRWNELPPSDWEQAEVLEQLRALQAGIAMGVALVDSQAIGVDTPEDLEKARQLLV